MVELTPHGVYLLDGKTVAEKADLTPDQARETPSPIKSFAPMT
ncbi:MAG: hypothetical protein VZQ48_05520 [Candidatus Cryptobacteroides sp.]|nr:hypothetical protein [Candidatus Cryptobacteroides sp.]